VAVELAAGRVAAALPVGAELAAADDADDTLVVADVVAPAAPPGPERATPQALSATAPSVAMDTSARRLARTCADVLMAAPPAGVVRDRDPELPDLPFG
jgi:hypothetical protein